MTKPRPLLRASDFCRPRGPPDRTNGVSHHEVRLGVVWFRPSTEGFVWSSWGREPTTTTRTTSHPDRDGTAANDDDDDDDDEQGDNHDDDTTTTGQESLVAFASVEVLRRLNVVAGTVVAVERQQQRRGGGGGDRDPAAEANPTTTIMRPGIDDDGAMTRRTRASSVYARLRVLPSSYWGGSAPHASTRRDGDAGVGSDDDDDDDEVAVEAPPVLYLSPMAAANLGLYYDSGGLNANSGRRHDWGTVTAHSGGGGGRRRGWKEATAATLVVWGRPVPPDNRFGKILRRQVSPSPSPSSSPSPDCSTSGSDPDVPLPPAGSILYPGSVLSVATRDGALYFLQVQSVQSDGPIDSRQEEGPSASPSDVLAIGTRTTRYRFVEPTAASGFQVPQLPPQDDAVRFLLPACIGSGVQVAPHPDAGRLATQFRRAERAVSAAERVMTVVGTDDEHHVTIALRRAATLSGRQCVDAGQSLAAYGYLHGESLTGSGSLVDKLRGLRQALTLAAKHSPSVLVVRLDHEFSSDKHERYDQESRVWSLLSSQIRDPNDDNDDHDEAACWGSFNVVTVLVSKESLDPDGPLAQHMVIPPFHASRPDDAYIRHLWGHSPVLDGGGLDALRGRPAQEVELLFRRFQADTIERPDLSGNDEDALPLLLSCCRQVDQDRRGHSHAQSRIPSVHWDDIGGLGHVRREVLDAIELPLRYPHLLPKCGECSRTGMLLWGPPGTGKTLVAKAVATECNLPFVSVRGPELMGSYIGESEENVRNVFGSARRLAAQNQPPASVLFFDELDSLAPRRGGHSSGGNVTDRVVAALLSELERTFDNFTVFCMGATNRPDLLDPALLRPGRLDRLVYLGVDAEAHESILRAQFRRLNLEVDVESAAVAVAQTLPPNLTGADLSTIASSALLRATQRLCAEADNELMRRQDQGETVTLEQVLDSWDESRLHPVVTLDDLLVSARCTSASVDESELQRYTILRDEFLTIGVEHRSRVSDLA